MILKSMIFKFRGSYVNAILFRDWLEQVRGNRSLQCRNVKDDDAFN